MTFPAENVLTDLVLEALTEGPRTGFEIATILETEFGASLKGREGALYAELIRLERDGFVAGDWEERGGGDRRRTYRLPVLVDLRALTAPPPVVPEPTAPPPDGGDLIEPEPVVPDGGDPERDSPEVRE